MIGRFVVKDNLLSEGPHVRLKAVVYLEISVASEVFRRLFSDIFALLNILFLHLHTKFKIWQESACWHQQARSVEPEEGTSAGQSGAAFMHSPPTLCFAGRNDGEWKCIQAVWCYVLVSPGSWLELRGDQRASGIYCSGGTLSCFFMMHMCRLHCLPPPAWLASLLNTATFSLVTFCVAALLP